MNQSGRKTFSKFYWVIALFGYVLRPMPSFLARWLLVMGRNVPGRFGFLIRYLCVRRLARSCGENVAIYPGVVLIFPERLTLGSNVSIHPMCYLDAYGGICIGSDVSIAHATSILSSSHSWTDTSVAIKYNPIQALPVTLEDDIWVGCGVRVLGGALVRRRSILAAGAVYRDRAGSENSLWAGVPARLVRTLN